MSNEIETTLTQTEIETLETATSQPVKSFVQFDINECVNEIHLTNNKGTGRTDGMPAILNFHKGVETQITIAYKGLQTTFVDLPHLIAYLSQALKGRLDATDYEVVARQFKHISEGTEQGKRFLSLTHTDSEPVIDLLAPYKTLFDDLGVTSVERNAKGSKLFKLFIAAPTNSHLESLVSAGFSNISPLLDGLSVVGLKVELPKTE